MCKIKKNEWKGVCDSHKKRYIDEKKNIKYNKINLCIKIINWIIR